MFAVRVGVVGLCVENVCGWGCRGRVRRGGRWKSEARERFRWAGQSGVCVNWTLDINNNSNSCERQSSNHGTFPPRLRLFAEGNDWNSFFIHPNSRPGRQ